VGAKSTGVAYSRYPCYGASRCELCLRDVPRAPDGRVASQSGGRFSRLMAPRGIAVFVATIWSLGVCDIWAANHVTRSARGRVTFVLRWLAVHLAGVFSDELRSFTADGFLRSSRELQARHKALRNAGAEIIPVRMRHPHKW
jgi:hypothetical protein